MLREILNSNKLTAATDIAPTLPTAPGVGGGDILGMGVSMFIVIAVIILLGWLYSRSRFVGSSGSGDSGREIVIDASDNPWIAGIFQGTVDFDPGGSTFNLTNTGIVDPKEFHQLMGRYDVRVFAFLMGNNGNWPLMRAISEASGGFVAPVSNADDVVGQVLLAKSKIRHESLHDAQLKIRGVKVFDTTDEMVGKVYRGQQLTVFGRYTDSGPASVELIARLTGEDRTYATTFDFPEIDTDHPEIERLWALDRIVPVYRVDLMKLALIEKNLSQITSVNLAGIKPIVEKTIALRT